MCRDPEFAVLLNAKVEGEKMGCCYEQKCSLNFVSAPECRDIVLEMVMVVCPTFTEYACTNTCVCKILWEGRAAL